MTSMFSSDDSVQTLCDKLEDFGHLMEVDKLPLCQCKDERFWKSYQCILECYEKNNLENKIKSMQEMKTKLEDPSCSLMTCWKSACTLTACGSELKFLSMVLDHVPTFQLARHRDEVALYMSTLVPMFQDSFARAEKEIEPNILTLVEKLKLWTHHDRVVELRSEGKYVRKMVWERLREFDSSKDQVESDGSKHLLGKRKIGKTELVTLEDSNSATGGV
jgi:hypothetical protein